ncbi:1-aminocyclopropane-1-carboxylate deaminase/D-cysteine desulfhydrase [Flavobacterium kayseriense]|uniref:1-aminocyclopropane-1-carboxylate deaminase/D-cysteine desulfhydrase n=1 Tax=Flavobacterium kayseriense TaxID=2764714 RepID=UPI001CEC434A|nr:pyridoxal-phosphate dependent enzyme [Flavobacterium kayseriense]
MFKKELNQNIPIQFSNGISVAIKREDLIHPIVSGNKFRKLKYNLLEAINQKKDTIVTFGGAFSNHIAAVAYAGQQNGLKTIGVIRGEELKDQNDLNPTLKFAKSCGMQFEFVSREVYRLKNEESFLKHLIDSFGDFYLIPEGGTNSLAVKGCEEILTSQDASFDFICCAVGTGGTISGIVNSAKPNQKILGFPALKGDFLQDEIRIFVKNNNWELITKYHFGGYGKVSEDLISFINTFYTTTKIPLDPIYTGKMLYGVLDLIESNYFPAQSKILVIHTGGLQGIKGMNETLSRKNLPILNVNV